MFPRSLGATWARAMQGIADVVALARAGTFTACVAAAIKLFNTQFCTEIRDLTHLLPADFVDKKVRSAAAACAVYGSACRADGCQVLDVA